MEHGRLSETSPAQLCRGLAERKATGCLRLVHDELEGRMYFRAGELYTATAPAARARLGDRLVGAGHISEEQLAEALSAQQQGSRRRIGELLVERGLIDRQTLGAFVHEQVADSVAACLGWHDGAWTFADGEEVTEDVPLDMSLENLLMEGSRRLEEWEVIRSAIGSLDAVVDFAGTSQAELSLTPDEWAMLTRIDGSSTVREISSDAGYGELETARIVYGLLSAGIVRLVDEDAPAASGAHPEAGQDTMAAGVDVAGPPADRDAEEPGAAQPQPDQAEADQAEADQAGADQAGADRAQTDQAQADQAQADQAQADRAQAEEFEPAQPQPEQHQPEQAQPEQQRSEQAQPEQPGLEQPERPAAAEQPQPEEPAAAEHAAPREAAGSQDPRRAPARGRGPLVDRNELLRELAALDDAWTSPAPARGADGAQDEQDGDDEDEESARRPPPPGRPDRIPPPRQERRGLFDRFRKG